MVRSTSQRHFLPLLLLISLCALFLFSHFNTTPLRVNSSSQNPGPIPRPNLGSVPNSLPQRAPNPDFTLVIKVLCYNRLDSVSRCLRSLASADYVSDTVHLHVYIDHFPVGGDGGSKDVDASLENSRRILDFVDGFKWQFGQKVVHYRTSNAGLQAQWLEAWWPSSDDEFAFVVEDDLEVSPLFYKFIRSVIRNYVYNASNYSPWIYGVTLQRPRFVPGKHGKKLQVDNGTRVFLYQLVGTWGQILFPKPWKEFRRWYDDHKAKGIKPILEGMVTTGWYRRLGDKIWTPWFIKFIHARCYFNINTNFLQERALSVSHRDAGVNYDKTAGPDSHLLVEPPLEFNLYEMEPLSNLKWYDFCFREVLPGRVVQNLNDLGIVLDSVQKKETVTLVNLFGVQDIIIRNMLCHFERLNIRNYILMGQRSELLFDLARRGHPIIVADQFLGSFRSNKLSRFETSSPQMLKNLMNIYVIKKCLELRYSTWVVNGNTIFPNGDMFLTSTDSTVDLSVRKSSDIIFLRSSSSMRKLWLNNLIKEAEAGDSFWNKAPTNGRDGNFADVVANFLESKGLKVKRVDDRSLGIDVGRSNVNQSSYGGENKVLYWPSDTALDLLQKRLEELSMWTLDSDSSCSAVVCHPS